MSRLLKLRRGNTPTINNNTPASSEVWHNTDTNSLHVGNGVKQGGFKIATNYNSETQAEYYGFDSGNSGALNNTALAAAISSAPDGGVVTINQSSDYLCDRVIINSKSIKVINKGAGRWNATSGGCFTFNNPYTEILSVSSVDNIVGNVEGSPARVTRLGVLDTTAYAKGDIVRLVSDEQDEFNTRTDRPKGESAIVAYTDASYIYLAAPLEDNYDTAQNVRIGKLQKNRFECDLKVKGSRANNSVILQMEAAYRPKVRLDITEHGKIIINSKGSYRGDFWLYGTGNGESTGQLSYFLNDSNGTSNNVHDCVGSFFRHIVTTNAAAISSPTNDLQDYGPTRDLTVYQGLSIGALGAPWDDHAGTRRSTFMNCKDTYPLRNSSTSDSSFQLRGKDPRLVNPQSVNPSQTSDGYSMVKISLSTTGFVSIDNPTMVDGVFNATFIASGVGAYELTKPVVVVNDGHIRMQNAQTALQANNLNVIFNGTVIENSMMDRNFTQAIDVQDGGSVHLNNVTIKLTAVATASPTGARVFRMQDNSQLSGNAFIKTDGVAFQDVLRSEGTTPSVYLKATILEGPSISGVAGSFSQLVFNVDDINDPSFKAGAIPAPIYDASFGGFIIENLPTAATGLPSGSLWNDAGTVKIVT